MKLQPWKEIRTIRKGFQRYSSLCWRRKAVLNLSLHLLALEKSNRPFPLLLSQRSQRRGKLPTICSFPSHASLCSAALSRGAERKDHMPQSTLPCHSGGCVPTRTTGQQVILTLPELTSTRKIKAPERHCTKHCLFFSGSHFQPL